MGTQTCVCRASAWDAWASATPPSDSTPPAEEILEGMNEAVRQGKARYIGIANVYAYQLAKMNALAEKPPSLTQVFSKS